MFCSYFLKWKLSQKKISKQQDEAKRSNEAHIFFLCKLIHMTTRKYSASLKQIPKNTPWNTGRKYDRHVLSLKEGVKIGLILRNEPIMGKVFLKLKFQTRLCCP